MLLAKDLHAYYGRAHILHGVSLEASAGEVVAAARAATAPASRRR